MAYLINYKHIEKMLTAGYFVPERDFPITTFNNIAAGIYSSPNTPQNIINYAKSIPI
jgi:hypothetical protein